jgi:peptidase S24-like protein
MSDPALLRLLSESLKSSGAGRIDLRGDSMLPTLRDGWKLHVRSLPATEIRVGDIAIFIHRDLLTIHRLIWIKEEGGRKRYVFQGDNNPQRETVDADAVLGRVEAAEGEWSRRGVPRPLPVGNDSRAFFYRNAYRLNCLLERRLPSAAIPTDGASGGLPYRSLRAFFRLLESVFSPRPRR